MYRIIKTNLHLIIIMINHRTRYSEILCFNTFRIKIVAEIDIELEYDIQLPDTRPDLSLLHDLHEANNLSQSLIHVDGVEDLGKAYP